MCKHHSRNVLTNEHTTGSKEIPRTSQSLYKGFLESILEVYTDCVGPWSHGSCGLVDKVLDEKKTWRSCFNLHGFGFPYLQNEVDKAHRLVS